MSADDVTPTEAEREALADAFGEWLHRMHGVVSSCDHKAEADGIAEAMAPFLEQRYADGCKSDVQHDAEVGARALREAADAREAMCHCFALTNPEHSHDCASTKRESAQWLRARADALTTEGGQP